MRKEPKPVRYLDKVCPPLTDKQTLQFVIMEGVYYFIIAIRF